MPSALQDTKSLEDPLLTALKEALPSRKADIVLFSELTVPKIFCPEKSSPEGFPEAGCALKNFDRARIANAPS